MRKIYIIKRISAMLAALIIFTLLTIPVGAAEDKVVEINNAVGLASIAEAPDGSYRLTADIDLGSASWKPIPFSGKLDGDGHTIYNLTVTEFGADTRTTLDGNAKKYNTEFAGLFSVIENAEIKGLNIVGAKIDVTGKTNCFAGILTGYSFMSKITDCSVGGHVYLKNNGINAGVAGISGYGISDFENCKVDAELIFEDCYRDGKCEQFLGGILSCGTGSIIGCEVNIDGYDSCHGYVHNGGLVGMYYHIGTNNREGVINNNKVSGQISFFEDNRDRRAYCKDFVGELLSSPKEMTGNKSSFKSNETKDYSRVLLPEKCEKPKYSQKVTPSGCDSWGYTEHICDGRGYTFIDSYTPPSHREGEWVTETPADYENEGVERLYCARCGQLLDEQSIPRLTPDPPAPVNPKSSNRLPLWLVIGLPVFLAVLAAAVIIIRENRRQRW